MEDKRGKGFERRKLYTRRCKKCQRLYKTDKRFGKVCKKCDGR